MLQGRQLFLVFVQLGAFVRLEDVRGVNHQVGALQRIALIGAVEDRVVRRDARPIGQQAHGIQKPYPLDFLDAAQGRFLADAGQQADHAADAGIIIRDLLGGVNVHAIGLMMDIGKRLANPLDQARSRNGQIGQVKELEFKKNKLLFIGIQRDGEFIFNPPSSEEIQPYDILLVMGRKISLAYFKSLYEGDISVEK